jgi:hypothetical protein
MDDRLAKLRATLTQLEAELSALGTLDDATREQLADAAEEIARSLRRGESLKQAKRTTKLAGEQGSLQDRLVDFEAAHPQLAGVVTRLLDGLAQLGI